MAYMILLFLKAGEMFGTDHEDEDREDGLWLWGLWSSSFFPRSSSPVKIRASQDICLSGYPQLEG